MFPNLWKNFERSSLSLTLQWRACTKRYLYNTDHCLVVLNILENVAFSWLYYNGLSPLCNGDSIAWKSYRCWWGPPDVWS